MKKNLVSIVVPVYKAEKFIEYTIKSVLAQTYKNWELILVNDCSPDGSVDIINKYLSKNVKLINMPVNSGVSKARNEGVKNAKGDYIAFLDADDLWDKNKLEKQMEVINKDSQVGLVFTGTRYINESGDEYSFVLHVPKNISYKELLKQNVISCSSVLLKKEYMLKYKFQNDNMHEDFAVWLQLLKNGVVAVGVDEPLLLYRVLNNSKSSNKIKAAKMNYRVYKFMKLNFFQRVYYMMIYAFRGVRKYRKIKKESI